MILSYYLLNLRETEVQYARQQYNQSIYEKRESLSFYSRIKELQFLSPIPLLHDIERGHDHPGYFPTSCWKSIFGRNRSRIASESVAIENIYRLNNSSLSEVSRNQMGLLSREDLCRLTSDQVHIFTPIQLSALNVKQLSSIIYKLSVLQLRYSFAARPLREVCEMGNLMESSGFMVKLKKTTNFWRKEQSVVIDQILKLSPLSFKIALSMFLKPTQQAVFRSINLWSQEQIKVVVPTLNTEEQFLIISHSNPKQKFIIQSCLSQIQSS